MQNKCAQTLLFTLLFVTQIPINLLGMEKEKSISNDTSTSTTNKLKNYLDQLDAIENGYQKEWYPYTKEDRLPLYKKNTCKILNEIMQWIHSEPQETIDINSISKDGNTLLSYAIKAAYHEEVDRQHKKETKEKENINKSVMLPFTQYLLEHEANPNIQNNHGKTAFFYCMWYCLPRFFPKRLDTHTPEILNDSVISFLEHNADPNISSHDNEFMCALAIRKYSETIKKIIALTDKACINKKNNDSYTPAHSATHLLNIEFLHMLAENGADFNIKDKDGNTPLEYILANKNDSLFKTIAKHEHIDTVIKFLQDNTQTNNQ